MRHDQTTHWPVGPIPTQPPAAHAATLWQSLHQLCIAAAGWIGRQLERRRSRLALLEMTDEQLKDIGLSRGEAHAEYVRHLWD